MVCRERAYDYEEHHFHDARCIYIVLQVLSIFVSAAKKRKSVRQVLQGKMRNSSEPKHSVLPGAVKQRYLGPRMAGYIHELICIELPLQHQDATINSQRLYARSGFGNTGHSADICKAARFQRAHKA